MQPDTRTRRNRRTQQPISRPMAMNTPSMPQPYQGGQQPQQVTPQVQTSITPRPVFNPTQTQYAVNQAKADMAAQMDPRAAIHGMRKPGMSVGAGEYSRAIPMMAAAASAINEVGTTLPFQDATLNAQAMLAGEAARENEFNQLAGIMNNRWNLYAQPQQQGRDFLLQLLNSL